MTLIGAGQLESRLRAIGQTQTILRQLAISVVAEQKLLVPRKTGNLGRSIHVGTIGPTYAIVVASADNAGFTNFGTRAHDIVPVAKKALRFAVGGNARLSGSPRKGSPVIFAKRVKHPGTKGTHWAERGAQLAVSKGHLADIIIKAWNQAA